MRRAASCRPSGSPPSTMTVAGVPQLEELAATVKQKLERALSKLE